MPSNLTKGTGTNLSAIIYGNWADLIIGYWSAFDLLVNPYAAGAYARSADVQVGRLRSLDRTPPPRSAPRGRPGRRFGARGGI